MINKIKNFVMKYRKELIIVVSAAIVVDLVCIIINYF